MLPTQKPSSARAVRSHLKCYFTPELGKLRLDQFGVENQQRFITRMPQRATNRAVSHMTVLNVLATLSSILTTARNWGYNCEQIDVSKLSLPPRGTSYEAPHFTVELLRQILAIAEEPWRTMFCLLTMDGLRAGEVLGLQWDDIDLERRLLHIRRSACMEKHKHQKALRAKLRCRSLRSLQRSWQTTALTGNRIQGDSYSSRGTTGPPLRTRLWSTACGRFLTRSESHGAAFTTLQIYGHVVGDAHRAAVEKVASIVDQSGPNLVEVTSGFNSLAVCGRGFDSHRPLQVPQNKPLIRLPLPANAFSICAQRAGVLRPFCAQPSATQDKTLGGKLYEQLNQSRQRPGLQTAGGTSGGDRNRIPPLPSLGDRARY